MHRVYTCAYTKHLRLLCAPLSSWHSKVSTGKYHTFAPDPSFLCRSLNWKIVLPSHYTTWLWKLRSRTRIKQMINSCYELSLSWSKYRPVEKFRTINWGNQSVTKMITLYRMKINKQCILVTNAPKGQVQIGRASCRERV